MQKPEFTKEESDLYMKIVLRGTMDDMFDFGYAIGRERCAQDLMEQASGIKLNPLTPKTKG